MFFSDIANFTTIAARLNSLLNPLDGCVGPETHRSQAQVESIEPAACLVLLSRYFNDMSKAPTERD